MYRVPQLSIERSECPLDVDFVNEQNTHALHLCSAEMDKRVPRPAWRCR